MIIFYMECIYIMGIAIFCIIHHNNLRRMTYVLDAVSVIIFLIGIILPISLMLMTKVSALISTVVLILILREYRVNKKNNM
ncbi:hypothetical protein [[Clostridium] fimetarium]|uniref:Uncharacterized protein n=1 Tax=[Clostridium] fimetarium TaxID=99656 RepID=A0A1I0RS58_9FIRM|nr:hypothetical protein [[Clostridium] fimetarium]SEW44121.1 hypothetical protein SAMN05421659_1223 [[Clostridium] fimetarium]